MQIAYKRFVESGSCNVLTGMMRDIKIEEATLGLIKFIKDKYNFGGEACL